MSVRELIYVYRQRTKEYYRKNGEAMFKGASSKEIVEASPSFRQRSLRTEQSEGLSVPMGQLLTSSWDRFPTAGRGRQALDRRSHKKARLTEALRAVAPWSSACEFFFLLRKESQTGIGCTRTN